jgi:hypothetical protein
MKTQTLTTGQKRLTSNQLLLCGAELAHKIEGVDAYTAGAHIAALLQYCPWTSWPADLPMPQPTALQVALKFKSLAAKAAAPKPDKLPELSEAAKASLEKGLRDQMAKEAHKSAKPAKTPKAPKAKKSAKAETAPEPASEPTAEQVRQECANALSEAQQTYEMETQQPS